MLTGLRSGLSLRSNLLKTDAMSEIYNVSGNLLSVKDSLMQFVSSGKQNLLSFMILIEISLADTRLHFYPRVSFSQLFLQ